MATKTKGKKKTNPDEKLEEQFRSYPTWNTWKKTGIGKRFGALLPLSAFRSARNQAIGDFADIPLFMELMKKLGGSIIQVLPINDMGRGKTPYSSISAFALDPVYIALDEIPEMKEDRSGELNEYLKNNWHVINEEKTAPSLNVDRIRAFKYGALYRIYRDFVNRNRPWNTPRWRAFVSYLNSNTYWLDDYAVFRTLKNKFQWASWEQWPLHYKHRDPNALEQLKKEDFDEILFHKFVQWTAYAQMVDAHNQCREEGVLIKGDIPLLIDFESAEVWARQEYFNLNACAGAPPDQYSTMGQNWGSPTYNWDAVCKDNYVFWRKRLEYASHFYDIFRIDHVVGLFRIWTYPNTPEYPKGKPAGWNGYFDPEDPGKGIHKPVWESHGKSILKMMVESCEMLPIGEDLGTIPYVCRKVMKDMGVPGYKVIIWERDWSEEDAPFYDPDEYEYLSMATTTTHDFWTMPGYWEVEFETAEEEEEHVKAKKDLWKFLMGRKKFKDEYTDDLHEALLKKLFNSNSVFLIMPFSDLWGKVEGLYGEDLRYDRINDPSDPGRELNWTGRLPIDLEDFAEDPRLQYRIDAIRSLAEDSGRVPEE